MSLPLRGLCCGRPDRPVSGQDLSSYAAPPCPDWRAALELVRALLLPHLTVA